MHRQDWIALAIGVTAAIGLVIFVAARGGTFNAPLWICVVLVAFMPLARSYGSRSARNKGRDLRERNRGG